MDDLLSGVLPAPEPEITGPRRQYWAGRINESWRQSVEAIFETGRRLIEARADPELRGEFEAMVDRDLLFGPRTARMLVAVARNPRFVNRNHGSDLPPNWRTLYELTKLTDETFDRLITDGTIRPDVERHEIMPFVLEQSRRRRLAEIGEAAWPAGRFAVLYADPPWRYDFAPTRSRQIENQYPTDEVVAICLEPVPEKTAEDAILYLWATVAKLPEAFQVLDAWGFKYRSNFVWVKDKVGMGYHARNQHEHLLVATHGQMVPPAQHDRISSVIVADRGKHSKKPAAVYEMIERFYPGLPKLELYARSRRPGWEAHGNQVQ